MTITDDQVRHALDHRLRAAGLADDVAPSAVDLPAWPSVAPPGAVGGGRRWMAVAAAVVAVSAVGAAVVLGRPGSDDPVRTTSSTTTAAETTTTATADDGRPELPPPWPRLETFPALQLDQAPPNETEAEFLERLPELDAQGRALEDATGRVNVLDDRTGEVVSVDREAISDQQMEAAEWIRDHIGNPYEPDPDPNVIDDADLARLDPLTLFIDGRTVLVYRADLDCTPLDDGRLPRFC